MKDFTHVNQWLRSAAFSDLTNAISRAVSRVTNARNDIFKIEPEYVSGYNSIQTLGYDAQGRIEDQTSSDRLTIPNGVLSKYEAILRQYRNALSVDRDQFVAELKSSPTMNVNLLPVTTINSLNTQNVLNFGGILELAIDRGQTIKARASVPIAVANLLGTLPASSTFPLMPAAAYIKSGGYLVAMIWSNVHTYPAPANLGDTDKAWRVVLFHDTSTSYHLIVTFYSTRIYNFHFTTSFMTQNALIFEQVNETAVEITSVADFEAIMVDAGISMSGKVNGLLEVNPDDNYKPRFRAYSSLPAQQQLVFTDLLTNDWPGSIREAVFSCNTAIQTYNDVFNLISTITPESLATLIDYLQD